MQESVKKVGRGLATLAAVALAAAPALAQDAAKVEINSGDTAWMLVSTLLVLMMTIPGVALFYGGMVRKMNVLSTVMQSFAITCIVTILWVVIGYSLAFSEGSAFIGGLSNVMLAGVTLESVNSLAATIPETVFLTYQMTF
ncbi:hypothetical protein VZ95_18985, partial [Elstera litoralis]